MPIRSKVSMVGHCEATSVHCCEICLASKAQTPAAACSWSSAVLCTLKYHTYVIKAAARVSLFITSYHKDESFGRAFAFLLVGHSAASPYLFYKKLENVSCEYDRVNGWNSTLQAAWYIRYLHKLSFARALCFILMKDIGRWLPWMLLGSTGRL